MTSCRLTVRTPEGVWQAPVDDWTGLVVLAALSAEPESFGELAAAVRRYQPEHRLFAPPWQAAEGDEVPADGAWCLVDLVGRTVVAGGDFELPDPRGAYEAGADDQPEGFPIVWLDTPADWLFRQAGDDWRAVVAARAAARSALPRRDARAVLFGRPLLEHLAQGVLAETAAGPVDEEREPERTRAVHAAWLMTARADLGGRLPREVLLADRDRLARDLERRAQQWSRQGHAPPPLPREATAYRLGGFGMTEVVLYFHLVRALLAEAWRRTRQGPRPTPAELVESLAGFRDRWLHEPGEATDWSGSPAKLIELERRRLPVTGDDDPIDDDCPLCQAVAAGEFGPSFMWFDGHQLELEDEFAFSLCMTREEWDRQQESDRKFAEEWERKERERAARGEDDDSTAGSVWQASFVDWDGLAGPDAPPVSPLLALGFPLAELVGTLQERPDGGELLRALNAAYAGLRTSQDAVARATAAAELGDVLEAVSGTFPDLTPRCADLQSRVDEVLRQVS
jgi:hypothetical protein